jgi:hypothetical protein
MLEAIGIILIVQGAGGLVNRLAESGSKGWWVQLHLLPDALHLPVSVAMAVVGVLLVLRTIAGERRRKPGRSAH